MGTFQAAGEQIEAHKAKIAELELINEQQLEELLILRRNGRAGKQKKGRAELLQSSERGRGKAPQ